MIISRTPYRISFFGGGTDYPAWYLKNGGQVLAATIDKYCYLSCRFLPPFFDYRFCAVYRKIERCQTIDEIDHPAIREVLRYMKINSGIAIQYSGDLPARSGMGSSSSFTVGLLHALYGLQGKMPNKNQLATESIYIEQDMIGETVGSQDQMSAAYGGFNHFQFKETGEIDVNPITLSKDILEALDSRLMLFYTGVKRTAEDVAKSYVNGIEERGIQLLAMNQMVEEGKSILNEKKNLDEFGVLLHRAWEEKRSLSDIVSNSKVDDIYNASRLAGAIGGKLTGAGGGGFLILYVPNSKKKQVLEKLRGLIHVPFEMESSGSQIIFHDVQRRYGEEEKNQLKNGISTFCELDELQC